MPDKTDQDSGIITTTGDILLHGAKTALMYEELRAAIDDGHESMTHADALAEIAAIRAENVELRAQLDAVGAGGVSGPLMGRASLAASAGSEPVAWRISCPNEPDLGFWLAEEDGGEGFLSEPLYTRTAPPAAGQDARPCHVFTVRKAGALTEWEPTSMALALPDGEHALYTHPSPQEGMAGWKPIETAPKDCLVDILNDGRRYAGCHYDRICDEYRHITACGVLIRLKNATHWMPIPPTTSAGSGEGE